MPLPSLGRHAFLSLAFDSTQYVPARPPAIKCQPSRRGLCRLFLISDDDDDDDDGDSYARIIAVIGSTLQLIMRTVRFSVRKKIHIFMKSFFL